jgi:hypothetical protein
MILPTKHIPVSHSLLGVAATVLGAIRDRDSITSLWDRLRNAPGVVVYDRFVLALDLLFIMGLVAERDGLLVRLRQ